MTLKRNFDHQSIEKKWKENWQKENLYHPDLKNANNPFYNLMMFPYPSAEGLHVGNMYAFTGADVYGRFNRMQGADVFEPIGLDGFGIHSENYSIKVGRHPKENAEITEKNFYNQLKSIGNGYAWNYRLETYDPNYYKWTQWLFIQMFKHGLAYRGVAMVNWCPNCKTVLADEQVEAGLCERCKTKVERREMASWYFRITDYAERLLKNIDGTQSSAQQHASSTFGSHKNPKSASGKAASQTHNYNQDNTLQSWLKDGLPNMHEYDVKKYGLIWPEKIKTAQRNWIGKKEGVLVKFQIAKSGVTIEAFTTRVDTIFGSTFIVVAPEFAKEYLMEYVPENNRKDVVRYIDQALNKSDQERKEGEKEKTGVDSGIKAKNPADGAEIPVYVADYVLMDYGTGVVMGVPAHDERDFEFASKYNLKIQQVIKSDEELPYDGEGELVDSGKYSGMSSTEAREKIVENEDWADKEVNYHLRDWLISRQRYWGPPIPMIFCENCNQEGKGEKSEMSGWYSVPEDQLPVVLPDIEDFKPKGDGTTPLSNAPEEWKYTKCPECGGKAVREMEVSDTFLDSSWYFLAYPNLKSEEWKSNKDPFNKEITKKWLPVHSYIGGAEHAVLHLLYSRFVTMALNDWGYIDFEEPFPFLFSHGLIIAEGAKMSKSRGNVINPDEYIEKFGADTLRTYLMFLGPYDQGGDFRDTGIEGMNRFLMRVWNLYDDLENKVLTKEENRILNIKLHQTIKKVTSDLHQFKYNTAISAIMELVNTIREFSSSDHQSTDENNPSSLKEALAALAQLIAPFAPFMAEELWREKLGHENSVHTSKWPDYDPELTKDDIATVVVQVNGKLRGQLDLPRDKAVDKEFVLNEVRSIDNVSSYLNGVEVKDTIFVPGKLVNFVVR